MAVVLIPRLLQRRADFFPRRSATIDVQPGFNSFGLDSRPVPASGWEAGFGAKLSHRAPVAGGCGLLEVAPAIARI